MVLVIVAFAAIILGTLNTTTTTVASGTYAGESISIIATCNGFGVPVYSYPGSSVLAGYTVSTNSYGSCYFGFYFSNGTPIERPPSSG